MIATLLNSARYARILRLLDLERNVILNGPLSGLQPLVERREAAMAEILSAASDFPEAFLSALKSRAERNSRLILSSIAGVKAATSQIEAIEAAQNELRTYGPAGIPVEVRNAPATRDKRA